MKKNNIVLGMLILLAAVFMAGCQSAPQEIVEEAVKIPVKTFTVVEALEEDTVSYVGVIQNDQVVKKSFKVQGRILEITVHEGDYVKMGDLLGTLEPLDLDFALKAAQADLVNAQAQLTKAKDALTFAKDSASDSEILFKQGALSKQNYDRSVLNLDLAKSDYNSALEISRQAKVALDQKKNMKSESSMFATFDGQVIKVLVEEGEMIAAGHPAMMISTDEKVVYSGVSQKDVQRISADMPATFCIDDVEINGTVRSVNQVPDAQTRTYQVSIAIEQSTMPVGAVGDVKITVGEKTGIRIPIQSVLSSSVDYVYIIENGQSIKRIIELGQVMGTDVFVDGLQAGEELVIEGMKNLKNLSEVQVLEK